MDARPTATDGLDRIAELRCFRIFGFCVLRTIGAQRATMVFRSPFPYRLRDMID